MQKKRLGNSDLEITPIGVGAWAMGGGGWAFGWGPQDDAESIAAIHAALDRGVNWIDTAAVYGLGHSEEVVARASRGPLQPALRVHEVRARLEREGRDSARCSRPIPYGESARPACGVCAWTPSICTRSIGRSRTRMSKRAGPTLAKLKKEGKVRWIGVSNFKAAQLERCRAIAPVTSLQPPYSAISPEVEAEILPVLSAASHRRDRVLAHEVRPADWQDDAGARGELSGGRLS